MSLLSEKNHQRISQIVTVFSTLSAFGFWGFIIIISGIQWSHVPVADIFVKDYAINLEGDMPNTYNNNTDINFTFIIRNVGTKPIDALVDFDFSSCLNISFECTDSLVESECKKSSLFFPPQYHFEEFDNSEKQQIYVHGKTSTQCEDRIKICITVTEPGYKSNIIINCRYANPLPQ